MSKKEIAKLTITLFEDDTISVNGPVRNKLIAYGMLSYAKDAIFEKNLVDQLQTDIKTNNGTNKFKPFTPRDR